MLKIEKKKYFFVTTISPMSVYQYIYYLNMAIMLWLCDQRQSELSELFLTLRFFFKLNQNFYKVFRASWSKFLRNSFKIRAKFIQSYLLKIFERLFWIFNNIFIKNFILISENSRKNHTIYQQISLLFLKTFLGALKIFIVFLKNSTKIICSVFF